MSDLKLPTVLVDTVEKSPHRQEILDKLLSGWSPARVASSIEKAYGEVIPAEDIAAFRRQLPPEMALAPSRLAKKYKQIDVAIDAQLETVRTLLLLRDRLDDALVHAEVVHNQDARDSETAKKADTVIEHRAKLLLKELREYMKTMHEIGELSGGMMEFERTRTERAKIPPVLRDIVQGSLKGPK